jgi:hypothetical protein
MTTFQETIANTRIHLMTSGSERIAQLLSGISAGAVSLALKIDAPQINEGAILGIGLEEFYVVSKAGTTVNVIPGFNGSTQAAHSADDIIRINAKFTDYRIGKYINQTLEDISGDGLFRIKPFEFTFQPAQAAYDINAADLIDVWRVRYDVPGPAQYWIDVPKSQWMLDQNANTTDFPNGKSLLLQEGGFPGHLVRVSYKASFAPLTLLSDDVLAVAGLHQEGHKLLPLGAAIDALGGREIKRTFLERQPEPRRQEEVPVGGATQAMRPILLMYSDALKRERRRLRRRYPDQVY